ISIFTFLHLPFYSTKRERKLIISHSSQLVLTAKTDYQYPRKEIQSPSAKPRAITNTPQNPHFYLSFILANIADPFSPSERDRRREASYEGVSSTMLYYHIKVKSPYRLLSAHAQLL